ncbi:MAG: nucleoside-diphosphate sugar epimerase/dehydratase [Mesorhizobium sp.]
MIGLDNTLKISDIYLKAALFGLLSLVTFYGFSLNRGSWRYASLADLLAIAKASIALTLIFAAASFLYDRAASLPRSVPPVMVVFLVFFLGAPRIAYRLYRDGQLMTLYKRPRPSRLQSRTVLLYGLTNRAEAFIRAVQRTPKAGFGIVGIIDDSEANRKMRVHGTKVLGTLADLPRLAQRREAAGLKPSELVISRRDLSPEELSKVVNAAAEAGMEARMLPDLTDLHDVSGQPALEPKPIKLADLLGRPENEIDTVEVARFIDGKSVLITGAGGSIGSELVRQVCGFNPGRLVLTDSSEHFLYTIDMEVRETFADLEVESHVADVRDRARIAKLFERYRPDVVFHAAALKQVPMVESNAIEAVKTNALGTINVADAALAFEARAFVMISTDKAVNPTNVMGATKRAAEAYCQMLDLTSEHTRFKTVRFGNVIGSNGSVVPRFREQIAKGGPVTVTHPEIVRYFMSIPEAVRLVLQAASHGMKVASDRGKILVLDMGKPVSILELATKMIQLAGYRPGVDIKIAFTGLRPGEKLYEELFDDTEIVSPPTGHGYSIATPRTNDEKQLQKTFSELKNAVNAQDETKSIKLLLKIVPEYTGNILTALASQDRDRSKSAGAASKPANQSQS